jgi:hypothetical protein
VKHAEKVFTVAFITNRQPEEILETCKQPFNLPTSANPIYRSSIVANWIFAAGLEYHLDERVGSSKVYLVRNSALDTNGRRR